MPAQSTESRALDSGMRTYAVEPLGHFSDWPNAARAAQTWSLMVPLDVRQEDGQELLY